MYIGKTNKKILAVLIETAHPREEDPGESIYPKSLAGAGLVENIRRKLLKQMYIDWCTNKITPFTYHVGHNIPESKGGETTISNLFPVCAKCNLSMSNRYTIEEWVEKFK